MVPKTSAANLPAVPEVPGDVPDAARRSPKTSNEERAEVEEKLQPAAANVTTLSHPEEEEKSRLIKPFVMQFNLNMKRLVMSAALLPSLDAEYSMENLISKVIQIFLQHLVDRFFPASLTSISVCRA